MPNPFALIFTVDSSSNSKFLSDEFSSYFSMGPLLDDSAQTLVIEAVNIGTFEWPSGSEKSGLYIIVT